jgi:starch synthase
MRILLASSEVHPYSKTGGLADMVAALAKSLAKAGHQVGVVTPLYRGIREKFRDVRYFDWLFDLPLGDRQVRAGAYSASPMKGLTVYFVDHTDFFQRASLYQDNGVDYPDNAERFIFFSKCVAHLARYLPWRPEIVHVHDWQVGLVPLMLQHARREGWGSAPGTCLSIHNLAFQGVFPAAQYALTNLPPEYFHPDGVEFYKSMNCLKAAINYSDMLTTVSPRYAREITTEEFGCGLDGALRRRQSLLVGILNGVDYEEWNTTANPHLQHSYSLQSLRGKDEDKAALQQELGLPVRPDVPLFANITRLADQKGCDILLGALEEMLATDMQFALLGSGSPVLERAFRRLAERFPGKTGIRIGYDHGLSHRIEAGADFFVMPSRFEPCGLNQMYSLRYGTIPIVRATGGLDDSVVDPHESVERANGIKLEAYSARALARAIRKALVIYQDPALLAHFRSNGMAADFSWAKTTTEYLAIYRRILEQRPV